MFYSPIKPMEPKSRPRPFDSDRHIFQVKWDGVRILSFINGREVRLQNRKLRDRTLQYPEMQSLSQQISGREVILDGEMIALKDGKPSFSRILRRDLAARGTKERVQEIPVVYMVFDLLYADDRDLTKLPWEERDGMLKKLLTPGGNVQITESIFGRGIDFYRAVVEEGLEGVVAKERSSPYLIGGKTSLWEKIKPRKDMNCVVGGYIWEGGKIKSLLIGAYQEGNLRFLGRAGSGLGEKDLEELTKVLPGLRQEESPFLPPPKRPKNWYWVRPLLTLKVEYMEFTSEGQLRHPTVKGFLIMDPADCVLVGE